MKIDRSQQDPEAAKQGTQAPVMMPPALPFLNVSEEPHALPASVLSRCVQAPELAKSSVLFEEFPKSGYAGRTKENAMADATLAIAKDFNTAGERLTRRVVGENGKRYIPVWFRKDYPPETVDKIVEVLNGLGKAEISLNIAGNGLYTFKDQDQAAVDESIHSLLQAVIRHSAFASKIVSLRSGGQTGVDEAGIKAAMLLGIPAKVTAPKGWVFRPADGNDVADETAFKKRFIQN